MLDWRIAVSLPKNDRPLEPRFSPFLSDVRSLAESPCFSKNLGPWIITPTPTFAVTVVVVTPVTS